MGVGDPRQVRQPTQVGQPACSYNLSKWSSHLSCKRDQIKMRDYMDRRVNSPTWGLLLPCKQALILSYIPLTLTTRKVPEKKLRNVLRISIGPGGGGVGWVFSDYQKCACPCKNETKTITKLSNLHGSVTVPRFCPYHILTSSVIQADLATERERQLTTARAN